MSNVTSSHRWSIEPTVGLGPLRLGMSEDEVRSVMATVTEQPPGDLDRPGRGPDDVFADVGVRVYYDDDRRCAGIEVHEPMQAVLGDEPLVGRPLEQAEDVLRAADPDVVAENAGLTSAALGIGLYAPAAQPVEGVLVTSPERLAPSPARAPAAVAVVDPDVTFAEIDAAAGDAGLDGGPTTVLPPLVAGEPELAEWSGHGVRVSYSFDPTVYLRVVRADGEPDDPTWRRFVESLELVEEGDILGDLFSSDEEVLTRTILAAGALGYDIVTPRLRQLLAHASPVVVRAAERTLRDLGD